jgi:hypothetical protein
MKKPTQIKALQAKSKRLTAYLLKQQHPGDAHVVLVASSSNPALSFVVMIKFEENGTVHARCTCEWARHGGVACSHVICALSKLASVKKRSLSFWLTPEEAQRQKQSLFRLNAGKEDIWITSRAA